MPRSRHAQGRPGTLVVPVDWSATHAPVIEKTFDCTVTIGPASGGVPAYQEATGQTETTLGAPVYSGAAAMAVVTDTAKLVDVVDEQAPLRRYEIVLLVDAADEITTAHVVRVVTAPDPMLVGKTLTIDTIERAGRRFSRVLQATLIR